MLFYRPYAHRQTLTLREVISRDMKALLWLTEEPARFFSWYGGSNRWNRFKRLELYIDGWEIYSWPMPKWGYEKRQLVTFSDR